MGRKKAIRRLVDDTYSLTVREDIFLDGILNLF